MVKIPPPVKVEVEGQHIFPDDELHQYAIRWKELNTKGRHDEAMVLLEKIVEGSTPMFERLAQHEKFHHTVDLEILVSAAQEKVVKWLLRWEPKLGKLFTWFSKSLSGDSRVLLADGTTQRIDTIVNNRLPVSVVTWDEESKVLTTRVVSDWIVSDATRKSWRKVSVQHPAGFSRVLFATHDHEFQTQRGWIAVDALRPTDRLYLHAPQITAAGIEAVVGMYLGDGHVNRKHALVVGHSRKQKFYVEHLAAKFSKNVYDGECTVKGKRHLSNSVCIPLRAIWAKCRQLERRKAVTPFVLSRLSPIALAYWFMDDGSFDSQRGAAKLATDGFSRSDCMALKMALEFKFGVLANYHQRKGKSYGYLQILAESRARFFELIGPYVLDGFRYKMLGGWMGATCEPVFVEATRLECQFTVRPIVGHPNVRHGCSGPDSWFTPDFSKKYDITVPGTRNFVAEGIVVHNCAKHAFLSELVKVNQYRKRYHSTDESLEKFIGTEDHAIDKHDLAKEVRISIDDLTCRWGDPQELGALRYLIECIIDEDNRDRQAAIRGAAYCWGISPDMAKFFYRWSLTALRGAFIKRIRVNFTEQDLFLLSESYSDFADFHDDLAFAEMLRLAVKHGGKRVKIPTLAHIAKLKEDYQMWQEIEATDKDPLSIAEIADRHRKSAKSATQAYEEMCQKLNPQRAGEFYIFKENDDT